MTDPGTRALARELVELRQRLARLELPSQGWARSVEESSLDFYDENGVLRASLGKQLDGSYGIRHAEGDIPPAPTEPDVMVISDGVVAVTWDGRWEERYSKVGWRNVQIHFGDTEDFAPDRDTQVGAIFAPRGGTIVAVTESDDDNPVWVRLVGMNDAGQTGDPSVAVLVDELDEDDLEEEQEELEWEDGDGHTLTAADLDPGVNHNYPEVTFSLSHIPEDESMTVTWGVLAQPPTEYTVDYDNQKVTWLLGGFEEPGDELRVHYAFRTALVTFVPYQATGWRYLQVASTDAVDRSGVAYDDSAWLTAAAPFGNVPWGHSTQPSWPASVTGWSTQTDLWVRRTVSCTPGERVTVRVRVDNSALVYWNGTQVYDTGDLVAESAEVAILPEMVEADNVLAVRGHDDGTDSYLDVRVEGGS